MMKQIDLLRANLLAARKEKNDVRKNLFSYLIGQCTLVSKEPSDDDVWKTLKAYVKSVSNCGLVGEALQVMELEVAIIDSILPQQLSDQEIKDEIIKLGETLNLSKDFKLVMKHFQDNYTGRFSPGNVRSAWESVK